MTKTLTEQWREGTLKTGSYYIRIITGVEKSDYFEGKKFCFWSDYEVEEVLAPVPSYDEYVELLKKLDELKKQLDKAESVLKTIALNLTTDPKDMRVAIKDWCCDQECLNLVNKYFEGKEVK